jgi:bifunctional non-homologous end joining protein LigD
MAKGYIPILNSSVTGLPAGLATFGGPSMAMPATILPGGGLTTVSPKLGPSVMLAFVAHAADALKHLCDPYWVMQKKYDGERFPVELSRKGVMGFNRKGQVRALSAEVEKELKGLLVLPDFSDDRVTIFDGELMGDVYVIYDILKLRDNDVTKMPFVERFGLIEELLGSCSKLHLLASTAWTTLEKQELFTEAYASSWEGVMFRGVHSTYEGCRSSNLRKYKLWATATCRVLTVNAARSVQVALRDDLDNELFAGNVTIAVNQDIPEPDSLIEVRYLYALDGGSLYQPNFIRLRTDIDEADLRSSLRKAPPEKRGAPIVV